MRSNKEIELYRLKEVVEGFYGFDISQRGRRQGLVYAKKVYSKLARDQKHTFQSIGDSIKHNHATILHHYNSFNVVMECDLEVYHNVLKVYDMLPHLDDDSLSIKIELNSNENIIKAKYEALVKDLREEISTLKTKVDGTETLKPMLSLFDGWNEVDKKEFIEYRLKPYSLAIKNRVFH